jgi:hypothetical protein
MNRHALRILALAATPQGSGCEDQPALTESRDRAALTADLVGVGVTGRHLVLFASERVPTGSASASRALAARWRLRSTASGWRRRPGCPSLRRRGCPPPVPGQRAPARTISGYRAVTVWTVRRRSRPTLGAPVNVGSNPTCRGSRPLREYAPREPGKRRKWTAAPFRSTRKADEQRRPNGRHTRSFGRQRPGRSAVRCTHRDRRERGKPTAHNQPVK